MDDTQQSRASDAAATRKRRSSILKLQRPPRAPLSELEFTVATPTDTAKSRRVSFSRRTGVAEFVTNEATTTWKNFYEEHNKTLESSGNETDIKMPRATHTHLGKHFEEQFQEVEAVDFVAGLQSSNADIAISQVEFDNISIFSEDGKVNSEHKLELCEMTTESTSRMFGNDIVVGGVENLTDKINVNFSKMEPMGDDLDEIERDLEMHLKSAQTKMCPGPSGIGNLSEYIEVDLNTTHAAVEPFSECTRSDDMSITDIVRSPKVNISLSKSISKDKSRVEDWLADKENIAVNPYVAPKETNNFAINEECDKVLVFDGKRLTIQSDREPISDYRKTLLPNERIDKTPQRKTIVLNVDDDLPNFVSNPHASMRMHTSNLNINNSISRNCDISMTQPLVAMIDFNSDKIRIDDAEDEPKNVVSQIETENRRTIVFDNDEADLSVTQATPANIITGTDEAKRRTIVFDNNSADISVTQALSSNVIISEIEQHAEVQSKRKTIVFDNENADISVTRALPANILTNVASETRKTTVYETDAEGISGIESRHSNVITDEDDGAKVQDKRRTIVFDNETADISVTQAVPANIITSCNEVPAAKKRNTDFENDTAEISVTEPLPFNVVLDQESHADIEAKRRTIVFDNETADISVTQAIPANIISSDNNFPVAKRRTIVFDNDIADVSFTQALPSNVIISNASSMKLEDQRKSDVLYDNDDTANISITQALPANIITAKNEQEMTEADKRKTIVFEEEDGDISMTQAVPTNLLDKPYNDPTSGKEDTLVYNRDISMTEAVPTNNISPANENTSVKSSEHVETNQKLVLTDKSNAKPCNANDGDFSIAEAVLSKIITPGSDVINIIETRKAVIEDENACNIYVAQAAQLKIPEIQNANSKQDSPLESSITTITQETADPNEADVEMTESEDAIASQPSLTKKDIGVESKVFQVLPDINILQTQLQSAVKAISHEFEMMSKKPTIVEASANTSQHLVEISVYQASIKIPKPDLDSSKSTIMKAEIQTSTTEMIQPKETAVETATFPIVSTSEISTSSTELNKAPTVLDEAKATSPTVVHSAPSVESSQVDRSCSDVDITTTSATSNVSKTKDKILDHLLNMNDSGYEVEKDNVAQTEKSSDSLFFIIRDSNNEDDIYKSDDEHCNSNSENNKKRIKTVIENQYKKNVDELGEKMREMRWRNELMNNRHYEEIVCGDKKLPKSCKEANNTKDLVDIISSLTEDKSSKEQRQSLNPGQGRMTRRSIVMTREDLMNNISMASALLERAASREDRRSSDEETLSPTNKHSPEVVKTLRFEDDESATETNVLALNPLKKNFQGEQSVRHAEDEKKKAHVIPTYLKDVSDGIKALMTDLVKPLNDVIPYETGLGKHSVKNMKNKPIQANLITSSQVDLDPDPHSDSESNMNYGGKKLKGIMKHSYGYETPRYDTSALSLGDEPSPEEQYEKALVIHHHVHQEPQEDRYEEQKPVIFFDPHNPLNNILINPMDLSNCHRYNPEPEHPRVDSPIPSNHSNERAAAGANQVVTFQDMDVGPTEEMQRETKDTYNIHSIIPDFGLLSRQPKHKEEDIQNDNELIDNESKNEIVDRSACTDSRLLIDENINTVLAMQNNNELLQLSSSLTLVEDQTNDSAKNEKSSPKRKKDKSSFKVLYKQAPHDSETYSEDEVMKETFKNKRKHAGTISSAHRYCTLSSYDIPSPTSKMPRISNSPSPVDQMPISQTNTSTKDKHKKTSSIRTASNVQKYKSPAKGSPSPPPDNATHKRSTKQKVSKQQIKSPKCSKSQKSDKSSTEKSPITNQSAVRRSSTRETFDLNKDSSKRESPPKSQIPPTTVTIQQLLTVHRVVNVDKELKRASQDSKFSEVHNAQSFDGSKTSGGSKGDGRSVTESSSTMQQLPMDWQPELINEMSSKNLVTECENDVDVVGKIKALPFMGSADCVWEYASKNQWRFLLLHGRLKLTIEMESKYEAELWGRVRADTAVTGVTLEAAHLDKRNPAGYLCVVFAADTMRYFVGRGVARAGDVPALLRRCAAVARVALRWRYAMHDAFVRLAFQLSPDGLLVLKVANIPLRCVWEVSMRVATVVEGAGEMPWPSARDVAVACVVGDCAVPPAELACLLARLRRDWGHAPRTVWKIFRYLRAKTAPFKAVA